MTHGKTRTVLRRWWFWLGTLGVLWAGLCWSGRDYYRFQLKQDKYELFIVRKWDPFSTPYRLGTGMFLRDVSMQDYRPRPEINDGYDLNFGWEPDWNLIVPVLDEALLSEAQVEWLDQPLTSPRGLRELETWAHASPLAADGAAKLLQVDDHKLRMRGAGILVEIKATEQYHEAIVPRLIDVVEHPRKDGQYGKGYGHDAALLLLKLTKPDARIERLMTTFLEGSDRSRHVLAYQYFARVVSAELAASSSNESATLIRFSPEAQSQIANLVGPHCPDPQRMEFLLHHLRPDADAYSQVNRRTASQQLSQMAKDPELFDRIVQRELKQGTTFYWREIFGPALDQNPQMATRLLPLLKDSRYGLHGLDLLANRPQLPPEVIDAVINLQATTFKYSREFARFAIHDDRVLNVLVEHLKSGPIWNRSSLVSVVLDVNSPVLLKRLMPLLPEPNSDQPEIALIWACSRTDAKVAQALWAFGDLDRKDARRELRRQLIQQLIAVTKSNPQFVKLAVERLALDGSVAQAIAINVMADVAPERVPFELLEQLGMGTDSFAQAVVPVVLGRRQSEPARSRQLLFDIVNHPQSYLETKDAAFEAFGARQFDDDEVISLLIRYHGIQTDDEYSSALPALLKLRPDDSRVKALVTKEEPQQAPTRSQNPQDLIPAALKRGDFNYLKKHLVDASDSTVELVSRWIRGSGASKPDWGPLDVMAQLGERRPDWTDARMLDDLTSHESRRRQRAVAVLASRHERWSDSTRQSIEAMKTDSRPWVRQAARRVTYQIVRHRLEIADVVPHAAYPSGADLENK